MPMSIEHDVLYSVELLADLGYTIRSNNQSATPHWRSKGKLTSHPRPHPCAPHCLQSHQLCQKLSRCELTANRPI